MMRAATVVIDRAVVSRASRIFPTYTHARMTSGRGNHRAVFFRTMISPPIVISACVYVGKIRLARETNRAVIERHRLYSEVTDKDAAGIAQRNLKKWKELSPFLGLNNTTHEVIERTSGDYAEQKVALRCSGDGGIQHERSRSLPFRESLGLRLLCPGFPCRLQCFASQLGQDRALFSSLC